jgi:hypothetical protein
VGDDFDPDNDKHYEQARREAWMNVYENTGELTDADEDDDDGSELCPECGNYTLMPAMFTGVGKALTEGKRCPDPGCGYNS